jgi:hypothetical protein
MADHPARRPAREPTPEEADAEREQAIALREQLINAVGRGREALWELAKACYEFEETRAFAWLQEDPEQTKAEWLAQPEIGMARTTFYRLVYVYREAVLTRGLKVPAQGQVDVYKVDAVLPAVKAGKTTFAEAIGDAEALSWRDLREKYSSPRPPITPDQSGNGADPEPDEPEEPEPEEDEDEDDGDPIMEAIKDWLVLRDELLDAARSNAQNPRIPRALIRPGVTSCDDVMLKGAGLKIEANDE